MSNVNIHNIKGVQIMKETKNKLGILFLMLFLPIVASALSISSVTTSPDSVEVDTNMTVTVTMRL